MARVADNSVQSPTSIQPPRPQAASNAASDDAFTQMLDAAASEPARPANEPAPRQQADRPRRNDDADRPSRRDDRTAATGKRANDNRSAPANRDADRPDPRDAQAGKTATAGTKPGTKETTGKDASGKADAAEGEATDGDQTDATTDTKTDAGTAVAAALIEVAAAPAQTLTPTVDPSLEGVAATPDDAAATPAQGAATPATAPVPGLAEAAAAAAGEATDAAATGKGKDTPTPAQVIAGQAGEQKSATDATKPDTAETEPQGIQPPAEGTAEHKGEKKQAHDAAQANPAQAAVKDQPARAPEHRPELAAAVIPTADVAANPGHGAGQGGQGITLGGIHALNAPGSAQGAAQAVPGSSNASSPAVPMEGVAVEIATKFQQGNKRFEIRLDPPELGRIDVRLDVDKDGQVTSRLVVDTVETLELLRRDANQLERALQQAGLKMGDSGLQFQLRDQSFAGQQQQQQDGRPQQSSRFVATDADLPPVAEAASGYGRMLGGRGGLDIRV